MKEKMRHKYVLTEQNENPFDVFVAPVGKTGEYAIFGALYDSLTVNFLAAMFCYRTSAPYNYNKYLDNKHIQKHIRKNHCRISYALRCITYVIPK